MSKVTYIAKILRPLKNQENLEPWEIKSKEVGYIFLEENDDRILIQVDDVKNACFEYKDEFGESHEVKKKMKQLGNYTRRNLTEFKCDSGDYIQICPNQEKNQTTRMLAFASSGSGKSCYISKFMRQFNLFYPESSIYIFSTKDSDEAFSNIKNLEYIELDDLSESLTQNNFEEGSLIVFDDIDSISNRELKKNVLATQKQLLNVGRSKKLHIVSTVHKVRGGNETMAVINESNVNVLFTRSNKAANLSYLKDKLGLEKSVYDDILNQKSRSVAIVTSYPNYWVSENTIKLF